MAAEAAWCAADQNKFFDYQHALYENFGISFTQASLNSIANDVGLDTNAFSECLSSRTHQADVENAQRAAMNQGVHSTPTFFINNRRVEGNQPYAQFQAIINQEIAAAQ